MHLLNAASYKITNAFLSFLVISCCPCLSKIILTFFLLHKCVHFCWAAVVQPVYNDLLIVKTSSHLFCINIINYKNHNSFHFSVVVGYVNWSGPFYSATKSWHRRGAHNSKKLKQCCRHRAQAHKPIKGCNLALQFKTIKVHGQTNNENQTDRHCLISLLISITLVNECYPFKKIDSL